MSFTKVPKRPLNQAVPWDSLTRCQQGDSLLKFGRQGDPHFRNFKLSIDFQFISWRSKGKQQRIRLDDVKSGGGFLPGNLHGLFKKKTKKRYDGRMCFSLDYTTKTLDLVCSNADQYHAWSQSIIYLLTYGKPSESQRPESNLIKNNKKDDDDDEDNDTSTRVVSNNDVYTWGFGGQGQLGHNDAGTQSDITTPTIVRQMLGKNVLGIACGLEHTVAMVKPGKLWAWGHGGGGRLGTKSTVDATEEGDDALLHELIPTAVVGTQSNVFVGVACGDYHTLGLNSSGHLHSWGTGFYGQLGRNENGENRASETKVDDIEDIVAIDASYTTSAAISSSGALYTWGGGECGKLGHGKTDDDDDEEEEDEVELLEQDVATMNLSSSNSSSSNSNNNKTLEFTFDDVYVPRIVSGLSSVKVRSVACGDFHTMVTVSTSFRTGGVRMFAWGNNQCGQLGLGDFTDRATPDELSLSGMGLRNIPSIACGAMHSAAVFDIKSIGHTLHVWGCGKNGQLGLRKIHKENGSFDAGGNNNMGGNSNGSSGSGAGDVGMGAKRSSFMMKIDANNGSGTDSKDDEDRSSAATYCTTKPTKLKLHLIRGGASSSTGSNGNNGSPTETGSTKRPSPRRTSVMGALHLTSTVSTEDGVGPMLGNGGLELDPTQVNCGANHTAVVIGNTTGMRQINMAGRVFVFGRNDNGQLGEVSYFFFY